MNKQTTNKFNFQIMQHLIFINFDSEIAQGQRHKYEMSHFYILVNNSKIR
jgi:hypothetical protein